MNEIFYIIGIATVGFLILKFLLSNSENKENNRVKRSEMIQNSSSCKSFIYKYEKSVKEGKPIMTKSELNKAIDKYLNTPEAKEEIQKSIDSELNYKKEHELYINENKKIKYKYEDEIYNIFYNQHELNKDNLIGNIKTTFKIENIEEVEKILELWLKHQLIEICIWNKNNYTIGFTLTNNLYNPIEDLNWKRWLKKNEIQLIYSKEFLDYINEPLPF